MALEDAELTERQAEVKRRFLEDRGVWSDLFEKLVRLDPEFLDRYRTYSSHPWKTGVLEPKIREFIYIAIDASPTHLYNSGTRVHINNAFDRGASVAEILEVLQVASAVGYNTVVEGATILADEAGVSGDATTEEMTELRDQFEERFGYWSPDLDDAASFDGEFFEEWIRFLGHGREDGPLDRSVKEFVSIAVTANATSLYMDGARRHIRGALEQGASPEEVMEVLQIASVVGIHSYTDSVPVLVQEAEKRGKFDEESTDCNRE